MRARRHIKGIPYLNPILRRWTESEIAMLHHVPPEEVARQTGRSLDSVMGKREQLRILSRPGKRPWTVEEESLLGTKPDTQLARMLKRSRPDVQRRRVALGIEPAKEHALYEFWTPEEDKLLGSATDNQVAKQIGRSAACVRRRRLALGLPSPPRLKI